MDIQSKITEKKIEFQELIKKIKYSTSDSGPFDDRRTWDNWNDKGQDTFDNRKVWDNWDNRYFSNKKKG